ncbi:MAG: PD40 domain-containing protein [Leptospiraceae bacterium]|nr:PD40 domain-containing protein [Leptospiraceae bacterium]
MSVNLAKIYKQYEEGQVTGSQNRFFGGPKNLTNSESNRVRSRESNPNWSPDGEYIAFSSDMADITGSPFGPGMAAMQNIWLMDPDSPEKARKLTTKGGVMPSFSPDGKKIIYVSYEIPSGNGDIFEIDIESGKKRQLTDGPALDFNPTYSSDYRSVIFTRISRDTNGDGRIDRKDDGAILKFDLASLQSQNLADEQMLNSLTLPGENVFDTRYVPFADGSIIFAFAEGQDINVAFVPQTGIIPRQKTIQEQFEFVEQFHPSAMQLQSQIKNEQLYEMALHRVSDFFKDDALAPFYRARSDLQLLKWQLKNNRQSAQTTILEINKRIKRGEIFYNVLIDLEKFSGNLKEQFPGAPRFKAANSVDYLESALEEKSGAVFYLSKGRRATTAEYLKERNLTSIEQLSENEKTELENSIQYSRNLERNYLAELRNLLAAELNKAGRVKRSSEILAELVRNHPGYYKAADILMQAGVNTIDVPEEYLFILYPDKYPYEIDFIIENDRDERRKRREKEQLAEPDSENATSPTRSTQLDWQTQLKNSILPQHREKVLRNLNVFFYDLVNKRQTSTVNNILTKYPVTDHPEIHYVAGIATARAYANALQDELAESSLNSTAALVPADSYWSYETLKVKATIDEIRRKPDSAFENMYLSILQYKNDYRDSAFLENLLRTQEFFKNRGETARNRGDLRLAWENYRRLSDLNLQLYQKKIQRESVERTSLEVMNRINGIAIDAWKRNDPVKVDIAVYYRDNMDFAKYSLNNSFIFADAYLNARLGMLKHSYYDEQGGIEKDQKREVLENFKNAERGFKWSLFADPDFADSYVMLGWIYQYIDTKRETILDPSDNTRDKDKFEALYKNLFPDYLFEENIRIYQQSIARFKNRVSPEILMSFYLNMGNNYFLLNNYSKAKENYELFLQGEKKFGYNWDTGAQKALFDYHLGKTYYYTSNYNLSIQHLRIANEQYEILAPIDRGSPDELNRNQQKREKILRSLAFTYDLSGLYKKSSETYNKILSEQSTAGVVNDRSFLHMQLGRLAYDENDFDTAYEQLVKAREYLNQEPETREPQFKLRVKGLGLYEPWTSITGWFYDVQYDEVYVGDNHLAFPLPTIHRRQYIASVLAEIFEKRGLFEKARDSLNELQQLAQQDKSKHGEETLLAVQMRLGRVNYLLKDIPAARAMYNAAAENAKKKGDLQTQLRARKNLLTIVSQQLELPTLSADEKANLARTESENLRNFVLTYTNEQLEKALKEKQEVNEDYVLTDAEKSKIARQTNEDLFKLILHDGTFFTYSAVYSPGQVPPASDSIDNYMQERNTWFQQYAKALQYNKGQAESYDSPGKNVSFSDKLSEELKLILSINRGQIYNYLNVPEMSRQEFSRVYQKADQFELTKLKIVAALRLAENTEDKQLKLKYLEDSWNTLTNRRYLLITNPELYENTSRQYIEFLIEQNDLKRAMQLELQRRMFLSMRNFEGKIRFQNPDNAVHFGRFQYLNQLEGESQNRLESLKTSRADTSEIEARLTEIRKQLKTVREKLLSQRGSEPILTYIFPEATDFTVFNSIKTPYLFSLRGKNNEPWLIYADRDSSRQVQFTPLKLPQRDILETKLKASLEKNLSGKELAKEFPWLVNLQPVNSVIGDTFWRRFPFEKIWLQPVSRPIHVQSQFYFEKTGSISRENVVMAIPDSTSAFSGSNADYSLPNLNVQKVKTSKEWSANVLGASVIDYEAQISGDLLIEDQNPLGIENLAIENSQPTAIFVSVKELGNINQQARYNFEAALEILAAAYGSGAITITSGSRSDNQKIQNDFLNGVPVYDTKFTWSGNTNIIKGWQERTGSTPRVSTVELAQAEKNKYTELSNIYYKRREYDFALSALQRATLANFRTQKISLDSNDVAENEDLFSRKDKLLLKAGQFDLSRKNWERQFLALRKAENETETARAFQARINRLFEAAQFEEADRLLQEFSGDYFTNEETWENTAAAFELGTLTSGQLDRQYPDTLQSALKTFKVQLPEKRNQRIQYFLNREKDRFVLDDWLTALYESNEWVEFAENQQENSIIPEELYAIHLSMRSQISGIPDYNSVPKEFWDFNREFYKLKQYYQSEDFAAITPQTEKLFKIAESSAYESKLVSAIYFEVLDELYDRKQKPETIIAALESLSRNAEKQIAKNQNLQKKAFFQLWASSGNVHSNPGKITDSTLKLTSTLSSGNQALANKLTCLGATFKPAETLVFRPFIVKDYRGSGECLNDLEFLRKTSLTSGTLMPESRRQMVLAWKLLRDTKKNNAALNLFSKFDRNLPVVIGRSQKTVRGLMGTWPGEVDLYSFNGINTEIEARNNLTAAELSKIFPETEQNIVYLPLKTYTEKEELLKYKESLIRTSSMNYENQTLEYKGWRMDKSTTLSSLVQIQLGTPEKSRMSLISLHEFVTQEPAGKINFIYREVSSLQSIPGVKNSNGVWKILFLDGTNEGAFLTFSEEFIRQKIKPGMDVETAFLNSQRKTREKYPLPQDFAGIWLVYVPGLNDV